MLAFPFPILAFCDLSRANEHLPRRLRFAASGARNPLAVYGVNRENCQEEVASGPLTSRSRFLLS